MTCLFAQTAFMVKKAAFNHNSIFPGKIKQTNYRGAVVPLGLRQPEQIGKLVCIKKVLGCNSIVDLRRSYQNMVYEENRHFLYVFSRHVDITELMFSLLRLYVDGTLWCVLVATFAGFPNKDCTTASGGLSLKAELIEVELHFLMSVQRFGLSYSMFLAENGAIRFYNPEVHF